MAKDHKKTGRLGWKGSLEKELQAAARVAVIGVGNEERGDDAAGPLSIVALKRTFTAPPGGDTLVLDAGPAPENFTGVVKAFRPDLVLILDAAVRRSEPGSIALLSAGEIADDDVTTHRIPLTELQRYLEAELGAKVLILGIEPERMEPGAIVSAPVAAAIEEIAAFLTKLLP